MTEILSTQWCAEVVALAADAPFALDDVTVEVQLTGAPSGRGRIGVIVQDGRLTSCAPTALPDAELKLKTSYVDALAMLEGRRDPNEAFMTGDLKTDGPTGPLLTLLAAWRHPAAARGRARLATVTDGDG